LKRIQFFALIVCCQFCFGCQGTFWGDAVGFFRPEPEPNDTVISAGYESTFLKQSSSSDVLIRVFLPQYELLSQSTSVIATTGQSKKGYKRWLKMVAFDEDRLTATRKYLLIVDERPKSLFVEPWANLRFNSEMVLAEEVLDEPYSNDSARRIAILRHILENVRSDFDEIGLDNKTAMVCGMLINQALETVVVQLDSSPVLAGRLSEPEGFSFEHINFDKGKMWMRIKGDVATVEIQLGSILKKRIEWTGKSFKYERPGRQH